MASAILHLEKFIAFQDSLPKSRMVIVTLSPIEQVQHRGHIHVYFCFPIPETANRTSITLHLQHSRDTLVASPPLIKGRIIRRQLHEDVGELKGFVDLARWQPFELPATEAWMPPSTWRRQLQVQARQCDLPTGVRNVPCLECSS
jgi:hypothetical protein